MHYIPTFIITVLLLFSSCQNPTSETGATSDAVDYFDNTGRDDIISGGVKMVPITTPKGEFKVWTKRVGNNPTKKLLLVHGGPGCTHEYFESFDSFLPGAGIEYYYYDQLESAFSDQPNDKDLWTIDRFVDEVEQVRIGLGLTKDNFYFLGHSWGGILGIEYALKYPDNIKGLIISNMVSSIPEYNKYANEVLGPQLDPEVLRQIKEFEANDDLANPMYTQLITEHYYPKHVLRMPLEEWPEPVNRSFADTNTDVYVAIQGPSEFGIVGDATLQGWDRTPDLPKIMVPTLCIGAEYDTMDPKYMEYMSTQFANGRYLHCPDGSHMTMYDDQEHYFPGLVQFINDVDAGDF
ncbi:MAG: proline iminopeptidase-family hydrolase [Bacteroidia bacterium]|nr:proline iminopeptidase-family hydrolase [Bacteroidia bacterium]